MIKNFEAMACGCTLFTWDQGKIENDAVGFVDMHNVVLYKSMDELIEKLTILRNDDSLTKKIALNGQVLVQHSHTWSHAAKTITQLIEPPLREKTCIKSLFGLKKNYKLKK
nr:glycosyltransferase [Lentisphaera araneosa]